MDDDPISVEIDGEQRFMGNIEGRPCAYGWTEFGTREQVPILPRSEWRPIDLSAFLPPVYNQRSTGACNAYSSCTVLETCRKIQGSEYARLSPGWLYGHINGQVDRGSMLEDALAYLQKYGTCLESTVNEYDWQTRKWGQRAGPEAGGYRIDESFLCPRGEALIPSMVSALVLGFVLNAGSLWYGSYVVDSDGRVSKRKSGGSGGHAYCVYGVEFDEDDIWFLMRNSWGENWGRSGNAKIHQSAFDSVIGGIFACRSASVT